MGSEAVATGSSSGTGIRLLADQTAADVTDGERKALTALFADIKESTELMAELNPEEARVASQLWHWQHLDWASGGCLAPSCWVGASQTCHCCPSWLSPSCRRRL
jgi:hypothetical protein